MNYTPQTNIINLTLSDDSKYLSGELPVIKNYNGSIYKAKYSFTFIVKNKEGKPVEGVELGFSKAYPLIKTDKNGEGKINSHIHRFYDDTYKIYIKYDGKEIEREILIKQNINEIVIELH